MVEDMFYATKKVQFNGKQRQLVCQKKPLDQLATLANFLILRHGLPKNKAQWTSIRGAFDEDRSVTRNEVLKFVLNQIELIVKKKVKQGHFSQPVADKVLRDSHVLVTCIEQFSAVPVIQSVKTFDTNDFVQMFQALEINLYHGLLPDPEKDVETFNAVQGKSLSDIFDTFKQFRKILSESENMNLQEIGDSQERDQLIAALLASKDIDIEKMRLIEKFVLAGTTEYGLQSLQNLCKDVEDTSLSLFVLCHYLFVLFKHEGELYLLDTDEETLIKNPNGLWRKLVNPGAGSLFTSSFSPVNLDWKKVADDLIKEEQDDLIKEEQEATVTKEKKKSKKKQKKHKDKIESQIQEGNQIEEVEEETKMENQIQAEPPPDIDVNSSVQGPPSLYVKFLKFLSEFKKESEVPYFMGQVVALRHVGNFNMEFCHSLIESYDANLALEVAAHYHCVKEDLRLCLCEYLLSAMKNELMSDRELIELRDRIIRDTKLHICHIDRVLTFTEFTKHITMYVIFHYGIRTYHSTTYLGRLMALGYWTFILRMHRSGWCWNGRFKETDMIVKIKEGIPEFIITLPARVPFQKEYGIADCDQYRAILFPLYVSPATADADYPAYFHQFQSDYMEMPDLDPLHPEKFEKFQKYIGIPMFAKAPLVRSTFICGLFGVCRALDGTRDSIIDKLDRHAGLPDWITYANWWCDAFLDCYIWEASERELSRFERSTYWCALMLGRHSIVHLFDKTKKDGVQLIVDAIITDLIVEDDLQGILARVVKKVMDINGFGGMFASIWRHFQASETFDEENMLSCLERILEATPSSAPALDATSWGEVLSGHNPSSGSTTTTSAAAADAPTECVLTHGSLKLRRSHIMCLKGSNWVEDDVMQFLFARMTTTFETNDESKKNGLSPPKMVQPSVAVYLKAWDDLPVEEATRQLDLQEHNLLLFPISNAVKTTDGGSWSLGTHWSLLVLQFSKDHSRCRFIYHDSCGTLNLDHARRLAAVLYPLLPLGTKFIEGYTPQQDNSNDCGVFMLALCKVINKWWLKKGQTKATDLFQEDWIKSIKSDVNQVSVTQYRSQLYEQLEGEMKKVE